MGYDEQLFVESPVRDEYLCPICKDVLADPFTITTCDHVFCAQCIQLWFNIQSPEQRANLPRGSAAHDKCPVCNQPVQNAAQKLKPTLRQFRSLLASLRLRCSFEQCHEVIVLSEFENHNDLCPHNPINVPVDCPKLCGAMISRLQQHSCIQFMRTKISGLERTIDSQKTLIDSLTEDQQIDRQLLDTYEQDQRQQSQQLESIKTELETSENRVKHLERQNRSVDEQNRNLQVVNRELREKVAQLESKSSECDEEIDKICEEFEALCTEKRMLDTEVELSEELFYQLAGKLNQM